MPGGPAHLLYGFSVGILLSKATKGDFSPLCVCIYSLNNFLGPDLGTWGGWFEENFFELPRIVSFVLENLHSIMGFVLVFSLPLAYAYSHVEPDAIFRKGQWEKLTIYEAFNLVVAGGLSHFMLETLFEDGGHTRLYKRIISTGNFDDPSKDDLPLSVICIVGSICLAVPILFVLSVRKSTRRSIENDLDKATVRLISLTSIFLCYFALQKYILHRAPEGEEADLGVILFLGVFLILPLALCVQTAQQISRRRRAKKDGEIAASPTSPILPGGCHDEEAFAAASKNGIPVLLFVNLAALVGVAFLFA